MQKILFDASVHLGQFCIDNEEIRVSCKNSQINLSTKKIFSSHVSESNVRGVCTFEENTRTDDIIWNLHREEQDTFYPFMDIFHSVKEVDRVPLQIEDMYLALDMVKEMKLPVSHALSCAVAIRLKAGIHTYYPELLEEKIVGVFKEKHQLIIMKPPMGEELFFTEEDGGKKLEEAYQTALALFKEKGLNLFQKV